MRILTQSTAANVMVFLTDSADHVTGKTGLTLTITASKDGGAFSSISPTVTERGNGWYNLALTTSHTDTLGDLAIRVAGTGADPADFACRVVTVNLASTGGKIPATLASGDVTGTIAVNTTQLAGQTVTAAAGVTFPSSVASPTNITSASGVTLAGVTHTGAVIPTVTTTGTATNLTNLPSIPANWLTATGIASNAITSAKIASGAITSTQIAANAIGASQIAADAIAGAKVASDAVTKIAAGVLDAFATASDSVQASPSPTTTEFAGSASLSSTDSFYVGCVVLPTSGVLDGVPRKITAYTGSTRLITVSPAWPTAPSSGDTFRILGRID